MERNYQNMKVFVALFSAFICLLFLVSCKERDPETISVPQVDGIIPNAVTDVDGNSYEAVRLGKQVWMAENLRVTRTPDLQPIPKGEVGQPYNSSGFFNSANPVRDGFFYTWRAAMNGAGSSGLNPSEVQGICPDGWHLPSSSEVWQLLNYVGSVAAYRCGDSYDCIAKALSSTSDWCLSDVQNAPGNNAGANNTTGFNAKPAGYYDGYIQSYEMNACFWCSSEDLGMPNYWRLAYDNPQRIAGAGERGAMNVRCVRD